MGQKIIDHLIRSSLLGTTGVEAFLERSSEAAAGIYSHRVIITELEVEIEVDHDLTKELGGTRHKEENGK